jgi:hypothetical protein
MATQWFRVPLVQADNQPAPVQAPQYRGEVSGGYAGFQIAASPRSVVRFAGTTAELDAIAGYDDTLAVSSAVAASHFETATGRSLTAAEIDAAFTIGGDGG